MTALISKDLHNHTRKYQVPRAQNTVAPQQAYNYDQGGLVQGMSPFGGEQYPGQVPGMPNSYRPRGRDVGASAQYPVATHYPAAAAQK